MILLDSSHDFWKNEVLFVNIGARVLDLAGYVFRAQVIQIYFLGPRSHGQDIFWDFLSLLDLSHDSWKNEVLFVKIKARVLDLWLDTSSSPK